MPINPRQRERGLFTARLKRALGQRLWPQTGLHRKQVAGAIGVHGETLNKWIRGEGAPSGEMVSELIQFFWHRGDRSFAAEVLNLDVLRPAPVAEAVAALDRAKRILEQAA